MGLSPIWKRKLQGNRPVIAHDRVQFRLVVSAFFIATKHILLVIISTAR